VTTLLAAFMLATGGWHDCQPVDPGPCVDTRAFYFACTKRGDEIIDMSVGPAYLCRELDGVVTKVRRNKLVDALDAAIEATAFNRARCEP
jgi:hypothetical protein